VISAGASAGGVPGAGAGAGVTAGVEAAGGGTGGSGSVGSDSRLSCAQAAQGADSSNGSAVQQIDRKVFTNNQLWPGRQAEPIAPEAAPCNGGVARECDRLRWNPIGLRLCLACRIFRIEDVLGDPQ